MDWDVLEFAFVGASGARRWDRIDGSVMSINGLCSHLGDGVRWDWWTHV